MKKLLCLLICIIISISSITVFAEESFFVEEDFIFDSSDMVGISSDETTLMAIEEDVKQALEEKLIAAWENMDTEVQLYPDIKIHRDDIIAYYSAVFFENPQYYYVIRSFGGSSNSAGYMGKLTKLSYSVDNMDTVRATWKEIEKATEEILFHITPDMTDFEKVMEVHDYMDLHYTYNIEDFDQTYFIMLDRVGVCAAYAEAFQHMMNVLGIEGSIVTSDEMGHMWNLVKLDGRWYHMDVTWDDPTDNFAMVVHEYSLLSTKALEQMGHSGFTSPYSAISTIYNDAPWRDERGGIVTIDGVLYMVESNNIVDETGNIIYTNLDGGDGVWNVKPVSGIKNEVFAGLCQINGILYFNTDRGICSYNPKTKETKVVKEEYGICGLYADGGTILYNEYNFDSGLFVKKGELKIADVSLGSCYYEDGKAVIRLYNETDTPLWIISVGDGCKVEKAEEGFNTLRIENGTSQTIYIWKQSLEPVFEKITISE